MIIKAVTSHNFEYQNSIQQHSPMNSSTINNARMYFDFSGILGFIGLIDT